MEMDRIFEALGLGGNSQTASKNSAPPASSPANAGAKKPSSSSSFASSSSSSSSKSRVQSPPRKKRKVEVEQPLPVTLQVRLEEKRKVEAAKENHDAKTQKQASQSSQASNPPGQLVKPLLGKKPKPERVKLEDVPKNSILHRLHEKEQAKLQRRASPGKPDSPPSSSSAS